jgi:hypothetical protein
MDVQALIYIGIALGVIGVALLITSNIMYYIRTRDKNYIKRFWLKKEILTKNEHILNRVGFVLTYGLVITFIMVLLFINTMNI